jgi:hypothetical protein
MVTIEVRIGEIKHDGAVAAWVKLSYPAAKVIVIPAWDSTRGIRVVVVSRVLNSDEERIVCLDVRRLVREALDMLESGRGQELFSKKGLLQ